MASKSDHERVLKLDSVNYELRVALRECRDQLERLEKFLELSEQARPAAVEPAANSSASTNLSRPAFWPHGAESIFQNGSARSFRPPHHLFFGTLFKFSHRTDDMIAVRTPDHCIVTHAFENLETVISALGAV